MLVCECVCVCGIHTISLSRAPFRYYYVIKDSVRRWRRRWTCVPAKNFNSSGVCTAPCGALDKLHFHSAFLVEMHYAHTHTLRPIEGERKKHLKEKRLASARARDERIRALLANVSNDFSTHTHTQRRSSRNGRVYISEPRRLVHAH